jgi:hypothetical protein
LEGAITKDSEAKATVLTDCVSTDLLNNAMEVKDLAHERKTPLQLHQLFTHPAGALELRSDGYPPKQFTMELQVELPWPARPHVALKFV